ncbi:hypothetical protein CH293_10535 [Rhodococcus sp. 14-2470-1b]|uniref:maleylpyruvate isomerase N-terminal domain-containing protein n=1 Tax=Rhodococcus sp. 14-2470-1b TaxID=2023149 RepID=UPI000B9C2C36|nr:maleylpyruvate isomerase N-terminal domain-containing protein [Rhodococcus sp. 14-2470-1b]OZF53687.1 hypothetical protein CH293_10535 [Rhodococcus sp. 14-2470-1b]
MNMTERGQSFVGDVRLLASSLLDGIAALEPGLWDQPAGSLSWTRWETAEHVADDLMVYAATVAAPTVTGDIPFETTQRRPGSPDELMHCDREAGPDGLAAMIEAASNILIAVVAVSPPDISVAHVFGQTNGEGFAAMAAVELIVHGHDLFDGTDIEWNPDGLLCRRVLVRLFPDVDAPPDVDPFTLLLWATGRSEMPDRAMRSEWRWYN